MAVFVLEWVCKCVWESVYYNTIEIGANIYFNYSYRNWPKLAINF